MKRGVRMKKATLIKFGVTLGTIGLALGIAGTRVFAAAHAPTSGNDIRFTKTLVTPQSDLVTIPDLPFTFDFHDGAYYPYTSTGVSTTPDATVTAPELKDQNITFSETEMVPANDANGVNTLTKQSKNVIDGITFPKVGLYEYKVTEKADTADGNLDSKVNADVEYDATEYTLRIWVTNDGNGGTKTEGTVEVTDPKGNGKKVDSNPTNPTDPTNPDVVPNPDDGKTFNFKNVYTVNATDKPVDPNNPKTAPFWVSKEVTGQMGDLTLKFDFQLNIAESDLTKGQSYNFKIKDKDGNDLKTLALTAGTNYAFQLKHGDIAYLDNITAGAQVTVVETDTPDYDETNVAKFAGTETSGTLSASGTLAATGENSVAYTNNQVGGDVTPTGILLNNLPYVALIVAAITGLAAYFINKRRHNA